MIDCYTKVVLTIIGMALLGLMVQIGIQHAGAQSGCGGMYDNPCYVRVHLDCGASPCSVRLDR